MNKRRKIRTSSLSIVILIIVSTFSLLGYVSLGSQEASLNINVESAERDIANLKAEIDALDMRKQKLISFDKVENIAVEKGYTYKYNTTTALAIGVHNNNE